uniref:Uncharacterized protein n=1 Tax=viral metagenome TaxID=1070528 RepID=A0A6C0IZK1_9ZZZZ
MSSFALFSPVIRRNSQNGLKNRIFTPKVPLKAPKVSPKGSPKVSPKAPKGSPKVSPKRPIDYDDRPRYNSAYYFE